MSEQLPYIPEELIREYIAIHLPVKSVGRFRCVSKTWRSLLSSTEFARAHLNFHAIHEPEGAILVVNNPGNTLWTSKLANERSFSEVTVPLAPQETFSMVLRGSCHGLVLICTEKMILFNPTTLETVEILESCDYKCAYSLGYDSSNDDYKIVELELYRGRGMGIYSVRTKTWRRNINVSKSLHYISSDKGMFVNGFLHWLVFTSGGDGKPEMAAFNFAREEFEIVPLPSDVYETYGLKKLDVLGGCLTLSDISRDPSLLVLWVMKKYGVQDSWTKRSFRLPETMSRVCGVLGEDELVLKASGEESVALNWRNGDWRYMDGISFDTFATMAFRESLISPI